MNAKFCGHAQIESSGLTSSSSFFCSTIRRTNLRRWSYIFRFIFSKRKTKRRLNIVNRNYILATFYQFGSSHVSFYWFHSMVPDLVAQTSHISKSRLIRSNWLIQVGFWYTWWLREWMPLIFLIKSLMECGEKSDR